MTETTETTEPQITLANVPEAQKPLVDLAVQNLLSDVQRHNSLAARIKAGSDAVAIRDDLKANPDNDEQRQVIETITRLEEKLEELHKHWSELTEPTVKSRLAESGIPQMQEEADSLAKRVRAAVQFLTQLNGDTAPEGLPKLEGRTNRASGNATGTGVRRYRGLDVYVDGTHAVVNTPKGKSSNLTAGAKLAGVDSDTFRKAFTDAQGSTEPENFKPRVEFTITDTDNKEHSVVVLVINDGSTDTAA